MRLFALALSVAAALGCGSSAAPHHTSGPVAAVATDDTCPMTVPGTSVAVEDTATGAALVFATTGDVAALRSRVTAWADGHSQRHQAMGPLPTGDEQAAGGHDHAAMAGHGANHDHAAPAGADLAAMVAVHSRAVATDVDGGARLTFTAFPDGIGALRTELRAHAAHLASGTCAMSHHGS